MLQVRAVVRVHNRWVAPCIPEHPRKPACHPGTALDASIAARTIRKPLLPHCPALPCDSSSRSPTEQQAAAGSADGTVFLWDIAKSTVAARLRDPKQLQPAVVCAWCPLGLPLVSCDKAGAISFWTGRPSKRTAGSSVSTSTVR